MLVRWQMAVGSLEKMCHACSWSCKVAVTKEQLVLAFTLPLLSQMLPPDLQGLLSSLSSLTQSQALDRLWSITKPLKYAWCRCCPLHCLLGSPRFQMAMQCADNEQPVQPYH